MPTLRERSIASTIRSVSEGLTGGRTTARPSRTSSSPFPGSETKSTNFPGLIIGIKEASGNYSQWLALAGQVNLQEKALLAGDDDAFAAILSLGGTGIISASSNALPRQFVELYKAHVSGNPQRAIKIQTQLAPTLKAFFLETNPAPVKFALSTTKMCSPFLRLPLVETTSETQSVILSALRSLES